MAVALEDLTRRLRQRRELPAPEVRRALRRAAGASQASVAEVVGVTRQSVSLWEAGTRTPRGANLERYLDVLRELKRAVSEDLALESASRAAGGDTASRELPKHG